ncbi:MAG TPA: glycosyltransferase family 2 protein [Terrimesophilobacter sp.]|nr:glycosyltransferase family 2 protein [Terrimesophilobacter sp.]
MLTFILVLILVLGVNTMIWGLVGICRGVARRFRRFESGPNDGAVDLKSVAVLIAARNEELVIRTTIYSVLAQRIPGDHVFVVSDGSTDQTAVIARSLGAQVLELDPNRGKAGAIATAIEHFSLAEFFDVVTILDADTQLSADYMATGLPLFDDAGVVAVAGRAATMSAPEPPTRFGRFLVAYRERFYVAVQYVLKFGQAARSVNVVSIVPGFASMYRAGILPRMDISAPGLVIEDFNMTFEVHAKRLGRIAFHPNAAVAYTQDPDTYTEYIRQLRRWSLGFWQTVRRHGFHFGRFWAALSLFILELVTSSIMLLLALPLLVVSTGVWIWEQLTATQVEAIDALQQVIPPTAIVLGVFVPDYLLTILVVAVTRRPKYLLVGVAFPFMRMIDAAICLRTLAAAFVGPSSGGSTGTWKSPARHLAISIPGLRASQPVDAKSGPGGLE